MSLPLLSTSLLIDNSKFTAVLKGRQRREFMPKPPPLIDSEMKYSELVALIILRGVAAISIELYIPALFV
jgi:hypothetical protein